WSDCGGDIDTVFTKDQLLANIAFYWFTGAIGSSFWPYYARMHAPWPIPGGAPIAPPMGFAPVPPGNLPPPPSKAQPVFTNTHHHAALERDGERRPLRGDGAARGARPRDPRIPAAAACISADCCARAASGHAMVKPAIPLVKSRRRIAPQGFRTTPTM